MSERIQSGTVLLSLAERKRIERKMLFDAQLVLGGASLHQTGVLLLTDAQLENAVATGNPLVSSAEQQEREARTEWLATPLQTVFKKGPVSKEQAGRMVSSLYREKGLTRVGHVLAYGRISTRHCKGIGPNAIRAIQAFIDNNLYGVRWQDNPTMEDIAKVCPTLGDVPQACLQIYSLPDKGNVRIWPRESVEELLAGGNNIGMWIAQGTPSDIVDVKVATIRSAAQAFADDFYVAQQRVEYPGFINRPPA